MKIYTPPIITAKGELTLGHGVNLVYCDVLGRAEKLRGKNSEIHLPGWNFHGRLFEKRVSGEKYYNEEINLLKEKLESKLIYFGLDDYETFSDIGEDSIKNTQESFLQLFNQGFVVAHRDGSYFLDMEEIIKRTELEEHLVETSYLPNEGAVRPRMLNLLHSLRGNYPITKKRDFATQIPFEANPNQRINPIFDLAVSPLLLSSRSLDYSIDSPRTLLHGTFIPFVIWSALKDIPFSRNVYVHGYLSLGKDIQERTLEEFGEKYGSDLCRYVSLSALRSIEDTTINKGGLHKGRKTLKKIINLGKFIKIHSNALEKEDPIPKANYEENLPKILEEISNEAFAISRDVSNGNMDNNLIQRYIELLALSRPVFPETYNQVKF